MQYSQCNLAQRSVQEKRLLIPMNQAQVVEALGSVSPTSKKHKPCSSGLLLLLKFYDYETSSFVTFYRVSALGT
jgi:hypothetical protein